MKTEIKKFNLKNSLPIMGDAFDVINTNRPRLEPWFWWASADVTSSKAKSIIFMLLYLLDTKHKEIIHKFKSEYEYDEQFLILVDGKFGGMMGLDNINMAKRDAEVWCFVSSENEGHGIASESVQYLENYSLNENKLNSLYAKVNTENVKSRNLFERNNYVCTDIQHKIRTSKRNPKIADIMTWTKELIK